MNTVARFARRLPTAPARRMFSANASQEQIFAEVVKWRKISAGGVVFCTLVGAYVFATEEHGHAPSSAVSYMKMRDGRPFPWECDDCGLFESKCWDECKERKAAFLAKKAAGGN